MIRDISRREMIIGATAATLAVGLKSTAAGRGILPQETSHPTSATTPLEGGYVPIVKGPADPVVPIDGGRISVTIEVKGAADGDEITLHVKPFVARVKYASGKFYADLADDGVPGVKDGKFYEKVTLNESNGFSDVVDIPSKAVTSECEIVVCAYNTDLTGVAAILLNK